MEEQSSAVTFNVDNTRRVIYTLADWRERHPLTRVVPAAAWHTNIKPCLTLKDQQQRAEWNVQFG